MIAGNLLCRNALRQIGPNLLSPLSRSVPLATLARPLSLRRCGTSPSRNQPAGRRPAPRSAEHPPGSNVAVASRVAGGEKLPGFFTAPPGPRGPQLGEKPSEFFTRPLSAANQRTDRSANVVRRGWLRERHDINGVFVVKCVKIIAYFIRLGRCVKLARPDASLAVRQNRVPCGGSLNRLPRLSFLLPV